MSEEKKGKTTTLWQGYLPKPLSDRAWTKMKLVGLSNQSQFVNMAVKFYLDNQK